jgi:hypothetical protein
MNTFISFTHISPEFLQKGPPLAGPSGSPLPSGATDFKQLLSGFLETQTRRSASSKPDLPAKTLMAPVPPEGHRPDDKTR